MFLSPTSYFATRLLKFFIILIFQLTFNDIFTVYDSLSDYECILDVICPYKVSMLGLSHLSRPTSVSQTLCLLFTLPGEADLTGISRTMDSPPSCFLVASIAALSNLGRPTSTSHEHLEFSTSPCSHLHFLSLDNDGHEKESKTPAPSEPLGGRAAMTDPQRSRSTENMRRNICVHKA